MPITSEEYDRVCRRARDISDIIAKVLDLRASQRDRLYSILVTGYPSEDLRDHFADYVDAAKGWLRP